MSPGYEFFMSADNRNASVGVVYISNEKNNIDTHIYDMKEIALVGTNCRVFADVAGELLANGLSVNAMLDFPEKLMFADDRLTVTHADLARHQSMVDAFRGYHDVVLTYNDDLSDHYTNDLTLRYFVDTVHAAREAGVARVVVVGAPESEAFFVSDLRRLDDIDWVFISTEGDYPVRATREVIEPSFNKEVFAEG